MLVLRAQEPTMGSACAINKENKGPKPIILLLKVGGSPFLAKVSLKYKDMFLITEKKKNVIITTASEQSVCIIYTAFQSSVRDVQNPHSAEATFRHY
jgi:hypothetical protein